MALTQEKLTVGKRKPPKTSREAIREEWTFAPPLAGESADVAFKRSIRESPLFNPSRKHLAKASPSPRLVKKMLKKKQGAVKKK